MNYMHIFFEILSLNRFSDPIWGFFMHVIRWLPNRFHVKIFSKLLTLITNLMSIFVPAIEKFWFAAKTHFNKRLLAATSEISRDRFRALVLESVNSVAQAKVLRLCEANREYVSRVLQSQAQQNQANEAQ